MSTVDRRLDLLTSELTARERAVLFLRAWCQGEPVDDRVTRYCPSFDEAEMDRICRAVQHVSGEANALLIIMLEWTAVTEAELNSVRVLAVYRARVSALEKVAKREASSLPPPWDTARRVPLGWGKLELDEARGMAKDWDEFWIHRLVDVEQALSLRWRDVLGIEAVFADIAKAMGEPMMHCETRKRVDWLRDSVLRLAAMVAPYDEEFFLPDDPGERRAVLRDEVDWEAIRGNEVGARGNMWESKKAEIEAWEREQAESLRSEA